jgi:hypothetical protein
MIQISMGTEKRRTSVQWPTAVDDRLRLLVELVRQSGSLDKPSSANELLAALVCAQPLENDRLARLVKRYRGVELGDLAAATARHGGARQPRRGRPRSAASTDRADVPLT